MTSFFLTSLLLSLVNAKVDAEFLDETHDREIAVRATIHVRAAVNEKSFSRCVPRESRAFPFDLPGDLKEKIFISSELKDLMKCSPQDCAFNFNPQELEQLEKKSNPQERQELYWNFFTNRVLGKTKPEASPFRIGSQNARLSSCQNADLNKLLDQRPLPKAFWRLSHVRYSAKMRPTTRLLQGLPYRDASNLCYAEALIFSDHYDNDRIEVWTWAPEDGGSLLQVEVRHRVDLLNTWIRRLNKQSLRDELKKALTEQIQSASDCLQP